MGKKIFRGEAYLGALNMGGSAIKAFKTGTVAVPFGAIGAGTTGTATVEISGVVSGDVIMLMPPELEDGLGYVGNSVTANGTVSAYLLNAGATAASAGTVTARYLWIDYT